VTVGEWFLLRSASQRSGDGYSFQTMEIWNEQGKLILSGSQTVAIFA
jgi:acyl-CoA thioesterase